MQRSWDVLIMIISFWCKHLHQMNIIMIINVDKNSWKVIQEIWNEAEIKYLGMCFDIYSEENTVASLKASPPLLCAEKF